MFFSLETILLLFCANRAIRADASALRALTFWGSCTEETAEFQAKQLLAALTSNGIVPAASATPPYLLARYNPPFTVWFMKKNEILIDIGGDAEETM